MKEQKVKLIAFDLDGTLLTDDKKVTANTWEVLKKAAEKGIVLVPSTGRPLSGIPQEIRCFPDIRYIVSGNGARIIDQKEEQVIYERLVPYETSLKLLEIYNKYDTILEVYYDGVGYADARKLADISRYLPIKSMAGYIASTRKPVDDIMLFFKENQKPSDKVEAIFADIEEKARAAEEVRHSGLPAEITGALANNIEANAKGVSKGAALLFLGEKLGVTQEEILAFGDGSNDITMLKMAGIGVAMANASEEVKASADFITLSNEEDGVAKAMEEYI